jgi:hypothetical protein
MRSRVARILGSLKPSRYPVASAAEHSTQLELWTEVMARPQQRLQPSPSGPAAGPPSRLAELQRLIRSH